MKKILALLLVLVMVFSMAACGNNDKPDEGGQKFPEQSTPVDDNKNTDSTIDDNEDDITEPEETEPTANIIKTDIFVIPDTDEAADGDADFASRNPSQIALNFVEAIAKNHYDAAVGAFAVTENAFIDGNDIKFSIPRSDYKTIADHCGKNVYLSVDTNATKNSDGKATVTVDMKDESDKTLETFAVKLEMNANNKWFVADRDFYDIDMHVLIPGDFTLCVGDIEVPTDLMIGHGGYNDLKDLYKLPVIGKAPKMFKIVAGDVEFAEEVLPQFASEDEPVQINSDLNEDDLAAALTAAETLWESLYNDYANEVPTTELLKYFAKSAPTSYASDVASAFEILRKGSSGHKNINHHITAIQKRTDSDCFYLAENIIALNFQYQMDWVWDFSGGMAKDCRHFGHIVLSIEDGEYKIHTISDPEWFSGHVGFDEW